LIIKHARLHAYVDDVGAAWAAIRELCAACGGEVANGERRKSGAGDRCEMLVRFPAGRFEEAMAAVEAVGEVRGLAVEADDVTTEYAEVRGRPARQRDYLADRASTATLWLELEARAQEPSLAEVTWREVVGATFRGAVGSLAEAMGRWSEANPALPPLSPEGPAPPPGLGASRASARRRARG
jgi:hypothetical protein